MVQAKRRYQQGMPGTNPIPVAAILDSHRTCFRSLQLGVNSFAQAAAQWNLTIFPAADALVQLERHQPAGVVLGPMERKAYEAVRPLLKDTVGVCGFYGMEQGATFPNVDVDDKQVGAMAADYFLNKGFRNFAFLGIKEFIWSNDRQFGFVQRLKQEGHSVSIYQQHVASLSVFVDDAGLNRRPDLLSWLQNLPKPVALLACQDGRAQEVTQIAATNGLSIPDDISVLGVDNDDLFCALSQPPLSSVAIPWERAGFLAAELLHRILQGEAIPGQQHLVKPTGIVERQSSDTVAVKDADVRNAMQFIRSNAHRLITVDDLVEAGALTRRTLERRFKEVLGYAPLDAIRRARLMRAKLLLSTTEYTVSKVATECGFGRTSWFSKSFSDEFGESPAAFRKRTSQDFNAA
jgi:LacI family transcriptional regulator